MESVMGTMKGLGNLRVGIMVGVGVILLGFFMMLAFRFSSAGMSPIYTGLSLKDSAKIVEELEKDGIEYELAAGGSQISVPSDRVLRLRLSMAEQGIPSGGSMVGYEIFDRAESFGSSNFVMNINMLRALEGELARTIKSLNGIDTARVHLVMPKRELFSREKEKPSASITIRMRGGRTLESHEVNAITHLVASSVPSLEASKVTIIDNNGKLLASGDGIDSIGGSASTAAEYRMNYEMRTQENLENLLEKVIGLGKVRVQVTADIDFNRVVTNSEKYDPDGQVARSVQSNSQKENTTDKTGKDSVSVANNLPQEAAGGEGSSNSNKTIEHSDEVTNYEISKTVQNNIKEAGNIIKLSVAVLVDGTYSEGADGTSVYTPRTEDELKKLRTLVSSAIGYDEKRGDKIELVNMRFTKDTLDIAETSFLESYKLELQSIIQTLIISVVAILAILLVLRPAVSKMVKQIQSPSERVSNEMAMIQGGAPMGRIQSISSPNSGEGGGSQGGFEESIQEEIINVANIKGGMKSSSMSKINEIVEKYPEETMGVLRQWILKQS
ncbi:MAG: flagellar basal-body MS-ring/collar protein FliF [Rickettsiales bacterium]|jgi:flagellar M-ring protein FliF